MFILTRSYNYTYKKIFKEINFGTCQKTAFSFNGKMYEQIDAVSMGASLGPVLANIIMTNVRKSLLIS